jgi:hypothetical protein
MSEFDAKMFKKSEFMKELLKEPQSRDPDKLDEIVDLFKNLRFMN